MLSELSNIFWVSKKHNIWCSYKLLLDEHDFLNMFIMPLSETIHLGLHSFLLFLFFFNITFRLITELLFSLISLWNTRSTGICHLSFQNGRPRGLPIPPDSCSFFSPFIYCLYKLNFEAESHYLKQKWKHLELELWCYINNPHNLWSHMGSRGMS